jgi:hypothetical protein
MHCIEENGEGRAEGEERQRMPAAPWRYHGYH